MSPITVQRPHRLGLLAGTVFVILVVLGFAVLGGNTPELKDSARTVSTYYTDHSDREQTASFVLAIATLFGAIFLAHLWAWLRTAAEASAWSGLVLIGAAILLGGFFFSATTHLALADAAGHGYTAESLRTLGAIDSDSFLPTAGGMGIVLLSSGVLVARTAVVPRWLGWIAVAIGILTFTPAGFVAFLAGGVWLLVMSLLGFARHSGGSGTLEAVRA